MASSAASAPLVDRFHGTFSDTFPDNIWGIDGTTVVSGMDNIQAFADGTFKDQFRQNYVFTSSATGKSVLLFVAQQFIGTGPIDNGDGTVTFTSTFKGLPEKIKLPTAPSSRRMSASSPSMTPSMRRPAISSGRRSRPRTGRIRISTAASRSSAM
jgi:hypothetical protein